MSNFVHLHLHSMYSLLDGACRLKETVSRAAELGQKAVAVTDHGVMYGAVDFYNETSPAIEKIEYDLRENGYALCILNAGGSHDDLTDQYAAIPAEMKEVAAYFGKEYLSDVSEEEFYARIG